MPSNVPPAYLARYQLRHALAGALERLALPITAADTLTTVAMKTLTRRPADDWDRHVDQALNLTR